MVVFDEKSNIRVSNTQNFLSPQSPGPQHDLPEDNYEVYNTVKSIVSDISVISVDCEDHSNNPENPNHQRDTISWLDFDIKDHGHLRSKLCHSVKRSYARFSAKETFLSLFPLFDRMRSYSVKDDLLTDTIAGLTIAILHIPQGIAYSFLIGISPVYGLYTSFFPVFIYAFMGTAQHISIGTMAVVDMMLSGIVRKYTYDSILPDEYSIANFTTMATMMTSTDGPLGPTGDPHMPSTPIEILTSICILTGFIQLVMGVFQMGAISLILSDQLVSGFSCGAAIHVVVSQIPTVFDISVEKSGGAFHLVFEVIEIGKQIGELNYTTLIVSTIVFVIIVVFKELIEKQIRKHITVIPIPIDLIVVVSSTFISSAIFLNNTYSVDIMGHVPTGLPIPKLPRLDYLSLIITDSVIMAVVSFAVALSLGKIYAKKHGYTVRANQEFFALGTANVLSSFFACFPVTASLSRTSSMGKHAKSQVASIISCGVLLLVLLYLAPTLYHLPKCVVAVIIIVAQKSLILQVKDFKKAWNISHYEGLIWIVTFLSVVVLDIDLGLIAGAVFSVFTIIVRFYHPKLRLLGQLPYTDIFLDIRQHRATREVSGIKIFQFSSPLFFLNKEIFQATLFKKSLGNQKFRGCEDNDFGRVHSIIIDCSAMSFIDSAGVEAIAEVANELNERQIEVALAACPPQVLSMLTKTNFFDKSPYTAIFPSVQDAVNTQDSPGLAKKMLP